MNAANAIRSAGEHSLHIPTEVIFGAAHDAAIIAFLEGTLRTTMARTTDATTRRAIRIKLDALDTMRGGVAQVPNTVPVSFG